MSICNLIHFLIIQQNHSHTLSLLNFHGIRTKVLFYKDVIVLTFVHLIIFAKFLKKKTKGYNGEQ